MMPVAIDEHQSEAERRAQALFAGQAAGWWTVGAQRGDGGGRGRRYVLVMNDGSKRVLRPAEVLPYVLGYADARGQLDVVLYRGDITEAA